LKIVRAAIVTDSLSSLQSITNWKWKKHSFTNKIVLLFSTLSVTGYDIKFHWVPAHQNISGNELADQLAKLSTAEPSAQTLHDALYKHVKTRLNLSDILPVIFEHCFKMWENHYRTDTKGNAYKAIFPPYRSLLW